VADGAAEHALLHREVNLQVLHLEQGPPRPVFYG
jgi:hypothetical protein